jgi:hypothetical protein
MTLHRRPAVVGILATLLVVSCVTPAQATVIDQRHYSFSDSFPDVACGIPVRHDTAVRGEFRIRVGTGEEASSFYIHDNFDGMSLVTNEANGNFVRFEHNGLINDVKGTRVSGSIFMFTTIVSGQPDAIFDMSGRVVARDRGVVRETYLFDTLEDVYLGTLDLQVNGPHPIFHFDENAACAIVRPLLLG